MGFPPSCRPSPLAQSCIPVISKPFPFEGPGRPDETSRGPAAGPIHAHQHMPVASLGPGLRERPAPTALARGALQAARKHVGTARQACRVCAVQPGCVVGGLQASTGLRLRPHATSLQQVVDQPHVRKVVQTGRLQGAVALHGRGWVQTTGRGCEGLCGAPRSRSSRRNTHVSTGTSAVSTALATC